MPLRARAVSFSTTTCGRMGFSPFSGIENPYAYGKAMAAYESARQVARLSTEGTFKLEEPEKFLPVLAGAHELMRQAAVLADEAREVEKSNDTVTRTPHFAKGTTRKKTKLFSKFE